MGHWADPPTFRRGRVFTSCRRVVVSSCLPRSGPWGVHDRRTAVRRGSCESRFRGRPGLTARWRRSAPGPGSRRCRASSSRTCSPRWAEGRTSHGLLPIENSIGGSIHRNYDLLLEQDLSIVGEVELQVVHNLLALPGVELASDPARLFASAGAGAVRALPAQAARREIVAIYDTAGAPLIRDQYSSPTSRRSPRRGRRDLRAGGAAAAIQDYRATTRGSCHGRARPAGARKGASKTSVVFALRDAPGALHKALGVFALRDIDMTKLESRPMRGRPWEYLFYVDLAAGRTDVRCGRALTHLAESAKWVKTLGSYARWNEASMKTLTAEAPVDVSAV